MTNREMTLALGELVLRLQGEKDALEGAFMEYRITDEMGYRREPSFRQDAQRVTEEESFQMLAAARLQRLHDALQDTTDANSLSTLHTHLLGNR